MDPYDSNSSDGGPEFPSQSTIPETLPFNDPNCVVAVLMELLGGQGCRVKTTSLRSFSTPLIPYPAQQCQPSASESSAVQEAHYSREKPAEGGYYRGL